MPSGRMTSKNTFLSLLLLISTSVAHLRVEVAPTTPKPYVLPNLYGTAIDFGGLIVRTVIPNTTSLGTFSLLSVSSGPAPLNLIHNHAEVEAFYTLKGSVQVFHNTDSGREVRANDFALLAPGNNHTYRPNDLDFQLMLCMAPGGIDEFFAAAGEEYKYGAASPFDPQDRSKLNVPKVLGLMPKFNISPHPFNAINLDFTNGTTVDGRPSWHNPDVEQVLPEDRSGREAYFVSSANGPKYLHRASGQVIARLTAGEQTGGKLSVATIALGTHTGRTKGVLAKAMQALQVTEGQLHVQVGSGDKREQASLIYGDVIFVPAGVEVRYWTTAAFTKFIVWAAGGDDGVADTLIKDSEPWKYAVWPVEIASSLNEDVDLVVN